MNPPRDVPPPRERLRSHADLPPRATSLASAAPPSTADNGYLLQVAGAVDDLNVRVGRIERDLAEERATNRAQAESIAAAHEGQGKIMAEVSSLKATVAAQGVTLATIQAATALAKGAADDAKSAAQGAELATTTAQATQATKATQWATLVIYTLISIAAIVAREILK